MLSLLKSRPSYTSAAAHPGLGLRRAGRACWCTPVPASRASVNHACMASNSCSSTTSCAHTAATAATTRAAACMRTKKRTDHACSSERAPAACVHAVPAGVQDNAAACPFTGVEHARALSRLNQGAQQAPHTCRYLVHIQQGARARGNEGSQQVLKMRARHVALLQINRIGTIDTSRDARCRNESAKQQAAGIAELLARPSTARKGQLESVLLPK